MVETEFLKSSEWSEYEIPYDQLRSMFLREYEEIQKDDETLEEDIVVEEAKQCLLSNLQAAKRGGSITGQGSSFGLTKLNNYIGGWRRGQVRAYENLLEGKGPVVIRNVDGQDCTYNSAEDMINDRLIKVIKNKDGTKSIIPLEKRSKENSEYFLKRRGKEYPASSNMANFIAMWDCSLDAKKHVLYPIIGGEQDDSQINPICPQCKHECYKKKCDNMRVIIKNGQKIKEVCGYVRDDFILPDIMKSVGTLQNIAMRVKTKDKKIDSIEWSDATNLIEGEKLTISIDYERDENGKLIKENGAIKSKYKGTLMRWIPQDSLITSKMVFDAWSTDKKMVQKGKSFWDRYGGKPVFFFCTINSMKRNAAYSTYRFFGHDETTKFSKDDDGLLLEVPEHVFQYNVKNDDGSLKFSEKTIALVVGVMSRSQEKNFKTNKFVYESVTFVDKQTNKQYKKNMPVYLKPSIGVSCIIPIKIKLKDEDKVSKKKLDLSNDEVDISVREEKIVPKSVEGDDEFNALMNDIKQGKTRKRDDDEEEQPCTKKNVLIDDDEDDESSNETVVVKKSSKSSAIDNEEPIEIPTEDDDEEVPVTKSNVVVDDQEDFEEVESLDDAVPKPSKKKQQKRDWGVDEE